jgi:hypothetical protein
MCSLIGGILETPPVRYPAHLGVRRVSANSGFSWLSRFIFVTHSLMGEYIGLEETDDGIWSVWFRDFLVGRFNERDPKKVFPCSRSEVSPMLPTRAAHDENLLRCFHCAPDSIAGLPSGDQLVAKTPEHAVVVR